MNTLWMRLNSKRWCLKISLMMTMKAQKKWLNYVILRMIFMLQTQKKLSMTVKMIQSFTTWLNLMVELLVRSSTILKTATLRVSNLVLTTWTTHLQAPIQMIWVDLMLTKGQTPSFLILIVINYLIILSLLVSPLLLQTLQFLLYTFVLLLLFQPLSKDSVFLLFKIFFQQHRTYVYSH